MAVSVSLHTKSTNTTVPVSQSFPHGLGETPKAAIFVMSRGLSLDTWASNAFLAVGFTDGTSSFSASYASDGAAAAANGSAGRGAVPLYSVIWGEDTTVIAEFSSWDATNITLSLTDNNNEAWNIAIIAIGGTGVSAKVTTWNTGTGTGALAITGVGFTPTLALHLHDGRQSTVVPSVGTSAALGLGCVDTDASEQWSIFGKMIDGADPSNTFGVITPITGSVGLDRIYRKCSSLGVVDGEAEHVSFNADGEDVTLHTATASSMTIGVLYLRGIEVDVTTFTKSTNTGVPVTQDVTLGITPLAVLSAVRAADATTSIVSDCRLSVGVADSDSEATFALVDIDNQATTIADDFVSTSKGLVMSDNATPTTTAAADVTMGASKVTYTWTTNDADAYRIAVLAFGSELGSGGSGAATRTIYDYRRRRV